MSRRQQSQLSLLDRLIGLAEIVEPPVANTFAPGDWRGEAYKFLLKHMNIYAAAAERMSSGPASDPYNYISKTRNYYLNCCAAAMNLLHQLQHADPLDGSLTTSPRKRKKV